MSTTEIGRRFKISQPEATRLSKRSEQIEEENRLKLLEEKRFEDIDVPIATMNIRFQKAGLFAMLETVCL